MYLNDCSNALMQVGKNMMKLNASILESSHMHHNGRDVKRLMILPDVEMIGTKFTWLVESSCATNVNEC